MPAPLITNISPVSGATGIYLNQPIVVTFSEAINQTSANDNTVLLYRTVDTTILQKSLVFDMTGSILTITPSVVFDQTTEYNVVIVGADHSTTCITDINGNQLAGTDSWNFTTGTYLQDNIPAGDEIAESDVDTSTAPSPVSEVLPPPITPNLIIIGTSPNNYSDNIGTMNSDYATAQWDGPITITFNQPVASGAAVMQDWVTFEVEAVDGDPTTPLALPSGCLSNVNGDTLTWTVSTYQGNDYTWCVDNAITVTVSGDVLASSGSTLGNDYRFMFTMPYFPYYSTVSRIRTTIGAFIREIPDDTIARNIHLNSVEAYNIANTIYSQYLWDISSPTFPARMWVLYKTQYDLLYSKILDMASYGPGMSKSLGDFEIKESTDLPQGIKGALAKALEASNAYLKLLLGKFRRAKAKMVVKGVTSPATPPIRGVRTWTLEEGREVIGANKTLTRRIKSPGIYSEWS